MSKATGHSWDPLRNLRPKLGSVGFHCIDSGRRTAAVCEAKLLQSRPRNRQEPARSLSTRRARCAIFRALGSAIAAVLLAVMPTQVVDAAGGCVSDGGVVPVEIVGVHPGLEPSAPVGF